MDDLGGAGRVEGGQTDEESASEPEDGDAAPKVGLRDVRTALPTAFILKVQARPDGPRTVAGKPGDARQRRLRRGPSFRTCRALLFPSG
jgi:hypothetical protein